MKKGLFFVVLLTLTFCTPSDEYKISDPIIYGKWEGIGYFADISMTKEYGSVSIKFEIKPDRIFFGTIGDAKMNLVSLENENGHFKIMVKLIGGLIKNKSFDKDHLIIFGDIIDDKLVADFHLKSNFIFDFSMNVGGVTLLKEEN